MSCHLFLKVRVDSNRGVRKETLNELLSDIVAVEGYLQFERVVSL
jgi:hypothetical protein